MSEEETPCPYRETSDDFYCPSWLHGLRAGSMLKVETIRYIKNEIPQYSVRIYKVRRRKQGWIKDSHGWLSDDEAVLAAHYMQMALTWISDQRQQDYHYRMMQKESHRDHLAQIKEQQKELAKEAKKRMKLKGAADEFDELI